MAGMKKEIHFEFIICITRWSIPTPERIIPMRFFLILVQVYYSTFAPRSTRGYRLRIATKRQDIRQGIRYMYNH